MPLRRMFHVISLTSLALMLTLSLSPTVGCATGTGGVDDDAGASPDGTERDASPGGDGGGTIDGSGLPSGIASMSPSTLVVPRGQSATVTVTLDQPAAPGDAVVTLDAPGAAAFFGMPAQVTIPAGAISATFAVTGNAAGGPLDVTATYLTSMVSTSVRVIPALMSISPPGSHVLLGTNTTFTVILEAAVDAPVTLDLSSSNATLLSVPPTVTVAAGASMAAFAGTGAALGGPVTIGASASGVGGVATTARVVGLYLSEVIYDISGTDDTKEWVELYNGAPVAIDVAGMTIAVANTATGYTNALTLTGTLAPGQCAVVGGPMAGVAAANFTPDGFVYFVAGDFAVDLGNAGAAAGDPGDGLSIVTAAGLVVDNVIYGRNNSDMIADEDGFAPVVPDITDVAAAHSIERTSPGLDGAWVDQIAPNPGNCTAVSM